MDVKIALHASCGSNQSLTGEPHTSFPNRLRSVLRWTSKGHSAGRLRWTSNRAELPFTESSAGVRRIDGHRRSLIAWNGKTAFHRGFGWICGDLIEAQA